LKKTRAHIFVTGKVQGVYFRQNTQIIARDHNVYGWVRNLSDGRVEAVIEGDDIAVKKMVEWCSHGPSAARVDSIDVNYENHTGEFASFDII
jgi:acylphosphatase